MYSTSKELTDAVNNGASYEEILEALTPLIEKSVYAKYIGIGRDDLRQELHIVLWNCWKNWKSDSNSSFLNYFITAIRNRSDKLYWANAKHNQQVVGVQCAKCGFVRSDTSRGGKCACGKTAWRVAVGGNMVYLDSLTDKLVGWEQEFDGDMSLDYVLPHLTEKQVTDVKKFIEGGECIPYLTREKLRKLMRVSSI